MASTDYPRGPVTILVSAAKGGPSDEIARMIAAKLTDKLSESVSVENLAPMNDCFAHVSKAAADGRTLVMLGGGYYINAALYSNLPFDAQNDFAPITLVASIANVLVVHPSLPVNTLQEFIDYAKARPGELRYGTSGFGGPPHLAGELFNQITGVKLVPAPYKGHVAAGHALVEGKDVQVMFDAVLSAMPHINAGEVKALAVTPLKRVAILPDVPTLVECGLSGYEINPVMGVMAPARTPPEIIAVLNKEIRAIMRSDEARAKLEKAGMEALESTPEEFARYMRTAFAKWAGVLKNAGIERRDLAEAKNTV